MNNEQCYGRHAVTTLLQRRPQAVKKIYITQNPGPQLAQIIALTKTHHIATEIVSQQQLQQLCNATNHQGVVALCQKTTSYDENDLLAIIEHSPNAPLLLILDGVQDPHNLGACLRSAAAANADALIVPKDRAVGLTATVKKVACGAADIIPLVQVTNLVRTMKMLQKKNIWLYGASPQASHAWFQIDYTQPLGLVLGAEGRGLRRLTKHQCDELITIPMANQVASINVSAATAVCLFEAVRQRLMRVA